MAPQKSIPVAANVLGLIGTVFWCVQILPQIWKSWRRKSTEGLPDTMMLLWSSSGMPFGVYAISQNFNIPLQIQPQFFCLFCAISWGQCMYYGRKWSALKATSTVVIFLAAVAGLQALFILILRDRYARGVQWASDVVTFFGILACIVLIAGYIEIPAELIKRRGRVVGISLVFLAIDWSGAFFSLMSLVAQDTFDITFGILYSLVAGIEGVMFISHGIWILRTRKMRKKAKEHGVTFDELPEAVEWEEKGYDVSFGSMWRGLKGLFRRE